MTRRLALAFCAFFAVVPAAHAAYPSPYAAQGGEGIASADGSIVYNAVKGGAAATTIQAKSEGAVVRSQTIDGSFGIPMITENVPGGLFRDGKTFVLQSVGNAPTTTFQLVSTSDLSLRDTIALPGTFSFDALSPNGQTLYLIQHQTAADIEHYIVRAYDLQSHTLLPGRIADKTQKGWTMRGWPITRVTTPNGRWAYTLYADMNGFPFVHALDTVNGVAHCVGFAWPPGERTTAFFLKMTLKSGKLQIRTSSGLLHRVIDVRTWRVAKR